ncbi:Polyprenyl synthetase family protein [Candidatus Bealeia paramacronuclearis]|uniref:Polyprenyl synthetase family protein n=1 Tax=Candidatus Bealeia paramacronuclearis TaxID=1921001 RepID=A0ABZ2C386_9PROT|nr:Polyprenyl synthetase family protein [Candidatus Bealeia paramacronuclearis]
MVKSQQNLLNLIKNPTSAGYAPQRLLIEDTLKDLLPPPTTTLARAMAFATLGGGKRLRTLMVLESAAAFGVPQSQALKVGAAVEIIHSYSLIHDDLPAMDNADLRRGKPTIHRQFDEATAILAGDALIPLAFEIFSDPKTHPSPEVRLHLITSLSRAIGAEGLVIGQMRDLEREGKTESHSDLLQVSLGKTGALFGFSTEAGGILGGASVEDLQNLRKFGELYGIAFQIQDDLLDVEVSSVVSGKTTGRDEALNKTTFVSALGIEGARKEFENLITQAKKIISD